MKFDAINVEHIEKALEHINKNGVPSQRKAINNFLVTDDGKQYPVKYVISIANYYANGNELDADDFRFSEASAFLEKKGFNIIKVDEEKYTLTITSTSIKSTDASFDIDDLGLGDKFESIDTYFNNGSEIIRRKYNKGERKKCGQTMPRLACQIYEKQIEALSVEEKTNFPICKYTPKTDMISGIFTSVDDFKKYRNTIEFMSYDYADGKQFVIYCWNIFSTIFFVQECLKRFGAECDTFVLEYRKKKSATMGDAENEDFGAEEILSLDDEFTKYKNPYSQPLISSKNIIFRGAPGTGKSYLAKEIATDIISDGAISKYDELSDEQKRQSEFVQFHPSYDYSDFVEGLRPRDNGSGTIGFVLKPGIFKDFVDRAKEDLDNNYVFIIDEINRGEISKILGELFFSIDPGYRGQKGAVSTQYSNLHADPNEKFYIPENVYIIGTMNDIDRSVDSFDFAMRRRFRFIEITAKESQSMLKDSSYKDEIIKRMDKLNEAICKIDGLNENYQIGAAYFLNAKNDSDLENIWSDQLEPLLQEYVNGMYKSEIHLKELKDAYFDNGVVSKIVSETSDEGTTDESGSIDG